MSILDYSDMSLPGAKVALRKANIDLKIKDRQLAAARARIAELEKELHIQTDKRIWSETKAWFNGIDPDVQWGDLEEWQRAEARRMYLEEQEG